MSEKSENYSPRNNPLEFAYYVTQQTLTFENHFGKATFENESYPLEIYDHFSRITGALISSNKNVATFNIKKKDIPYLLKRSDFALTKYMENQMITENNSSEDVLSPAYTVKISSGKLKGKTPAEVLLENPDNKELLNSQYAFIKKNMEDPKNKKYERMNKLQLDAIVDAAKLLSSGELNAEHVVEDVVIPIYTPGFRPIIRKKRDDGKSFVYDVKIVMHLNSEYPIEVTVSNFYAPVVKTEAGLLNVKVTEKDESSEIRNTVSIPIDAWEDIVYNISMQMRCFETCSFANAYSMATTQDKANYNNSKN
jgi:hypothetical protein